MGQFPSSALPRRAAVEAVARAAGVTRVARVTGLDRAGVEVACAVRPGGHVLQVSNGKGLSWEQARAGAVLEAAELCAAERPDPAALVWGSAEELGARALGLPELVAAPRLAAPGVRRAWVRARELRSGGEALVPAGAVFCPPADGPWLGPAAHRWTSNGMGAHPDPEAALRHALLEAAERDGLARALPHGWTRAALQRRMLLPASLRRAAPETAALAARLEAQGLRAFLFDLRPAGRWPPLALAGALLVDGEQGPVPLTAGYACSTGREAALLGALLEAAQSRLTDVHGAREDVAAPDRPSLAALAEACARARPQASASALPDRPGDGVGALLRGLDAAGFDRVAAVELWPPGLPAAVVKVLVPGFGLSELL